MFLPHHHIQEFLNRPSFQFWPISRKQNEIEKWFRNQYEILEKT